MSPANTQAPNSHVPTGVVLKGNKGPVGIKNDLVKGEYRVVNQFANVYSISELAAKVADVCRHFDIEVQITKLKNLRKEKERHYYNPENQNLKNLGYTPSTDFNDEIKKLLLSIKPFRARILKYGDNLNPTIAW